MSGKDIARHELIGLNAVVAQSSNKSLEGISGKVIDETKSTFTILCNAGNALKRKKVLKKECEFVFELRQGGRARIDGKLLAQRPEDRIKMKIK